MNLSDDPTDRLIDSLLREQARGRADDALLQEIEVGLVAADHSRLERSSSRYKRILAIAAVFILTCFVAMSWYGTRKMIERSRQLSVARTSEKSRPSVGSDAERKRPEAHVEASRSRGPAIPDPAERGEDLAEPTALEGTAGREKMGEDVSTLLARLDYVRSDATKWYVPFGVESEGKWAPRLVGLTAKGERFQNHVEFAAMLNPGDLFFKEGPMAGRFKFIGMVEREVVSKRTRLAQMTRFAQYEDMRATRRGQRYESQANLPEAELGDRAYEDLTAVFHFYPEGGQKIEFEVQEGAMFSLPPGQGEARFSLKRVERDHVDVEFQTGTGETGTRTISLK
jgi:hypothetical protein